MNVSESDDEVVICEQNELIEIDDTDDDEFNGTSSTRPAPNIAKTRRTRAARNKRSGNQLPGVLVNEAKRIPLHKDTVERICKHFGVDFNPEWSLQQVQKVFKERTQMYKKTPELRDAIAHQRHHWCRRLVIQFLPNWFEIYHVITLIRLMSKFNVNKPTFFVKVKKNGKIVRKLRRIDPENSALCMINFLYIEDCRQLLYDMQRLQCFKNNIKVFVTLGMFQKLKPQTTITALNCIKQFRLTQSIWCPDTDKVNEIHDSEEDPCQSYEFPLLADLQNNFKERIDPVLEVLQNENQLIASEIKNLEEKISPNLKNDQTESCTTVVMHNILNTWGHEEINNLIKSTTGQKMEFITHIFSENRDNTVKYLVKFATHKEAVKVYTALNGIVVCNKKLKVEFETGHEFDAKLSTLKRKLQSDWSPENHQPGSKKPRTNFIPTARATTEHTPRFMQNMSARAPNMNRKTRPPHYTSHYNHSAVQNPHFTPPNRYFAPRNPYSASQNSYFAPHNPYIAPQYRYAPQNQHFQHNWNQSIPQNQNWQRNNYYNNDIWINRTPGPRSKVENSKNLKQVQIIPKKETIVIKNEMPIASGSQDTQPHIQIQDTKPVKKEIVIKKEPGIVIKKEPGEAGYQNNQFHQECNNIMQNIKKERE